MALGAAVAGLAPTMLITAALKTSNIRIKWEVPSQAPLQP